MTLANTGCTADMPRPKKPDALTGAERIKAYRAKRAAEGAREVTIRLEPANAEKAAALAEHRGLTLNALINALVAEADD